MLITPRSGCLSILRHADLFPARASRQGMPMSQEAAGLAPSPPLCIMATSPILFEGEGRGEGSAAGPDGSRTAPHQATPASTGGLIRSLAVITVCVSLPGAKPNPWSIRLIFFPPRSECLILKWREKGTRGLAGHIAVGPFERFSRPCRGASRIGGGGAARFRWLHHRLISFEPPARRS